MYCTAKETGFFFKITSLPLQILCLFCWHSHFMDMLIIEITYAICQPCGILVMARGEHTDPPIDRYPMALMLLEEDVDFPSKIVGSTKSIPTCLVATDYETKNDKCCAHEFKLEQAKKAKLKWDSGSPCHSNP